MVNPNFKQDLRLLRYFPRKPADLDGAGALYFVASLSVQEDLLAAVETGGARRCEATGIKPTDDQSQTDTVSLRVDEKPKSADLTLTNR